MKFGAVAFLRVCRLSRGLRLRVLAAMLALAQGSGVLAAQAIVMTRDNMAAVLAAVKPGDTVRLEGEFRDRFFIRDRDFGGVTFDASRAVLRNGMRLQRVHNLHVVGGTFYSPGIGDAIRVEHSSHISYAGLTIFGDGNRLGAGARVLDSSFVTLRDSLYEGLRNGAIFGRTTDSISVRNHFANGGEDGMKIADSHRIILSHNICTGFAPLPGYHADCLQLWSMPDRPLQTDIYLLNNYAHGPQQSFVSFTPVALSGMRLTFAGNYAATTTGHTITCNGCTDSVFLDNTLVILPAARWGAVLKVNQANSSNRVANNSYFDLRGRFDAPLPDHVFSDLVPSIAGQVGSRWDDRSFGLRATASVPEPDSWALLLAGFGLVGGVLRRRRVVAPAGAA